MNELVVHSGSALRGSVTVPGDKSISHRALLLSAIAEGTSRVQGYLDAADCRATLRCLRALGVSVLESGPSSLVVSGMGLDGLREPAEPLDCGGSATTMRLLCGILAGQPFRSVLTGNEQLRRRPMGRVARPLRQMGALVATSDGHAPLTIEGRHLMGVDYTLPVPSAQVKSAILLAGLFAQSTTTVREPGPARDHTERILKAMGADLIVDGPVISLRPGRPLEARDVTVPGDISSAVFPLAAALLVPGSNITVRDVGVNPTRTGMLDVLRQMGAPLRRDAEQLASGEPLADLTIRPGPLRGTTIEGNLIPRLIDELPLLALVATQAEGTTIVRDAAELRVKETDRIANVASELAKMGARIEPLWDGFVVHGPTPLTGALVDSFGDHRLAMTLAVAGALAEGSTRIRDAYCIGDSFPGFATTMRRLGVRIG